MSLHEHLKALIYADSGASATDSASPAAPQEIPPVVLSDEQMDAVDDMAGIA